MFDPLDAARQRWAERCAIVAGDPDQSEMYRRVSSTNQAYRMPPAYMGRDKLSDREIKAVADYIAGLR